MSSSHFSAAPIFRRSRATDMPAFGDLLRRVAEYYQRTRRGDRRAKRSRLKRAFAALAPEPAPADIALDAAPLRERARCARTLIRCRVRRLHARRRNFRTPAASSAACGIGTPPPAGTEPGSEGAVHGDPDADAHGRRRHVRSTGRRIRALLGRSPLDDPALRENAVRQWPAAVRVMRAPRSPPASRCLRRSPLKPPTGCCATCARRTAAFTPASMRIREGHEGKFYVWTPAEVQALLTPREYAAFRARFGLDRAANFEGAWHLHACAIDRCHRRRARRTAQSVAALIELGARQTA